MGALPRPQLEPGPQRALNDAALHALHHRAGWPTLRNLASDAGCSRSSAPGPKWGLGALLCTLGHMPTRIDSEAEREHNRRTAQGKVHRMWTWIFIGVSILVIVTLLALSGRTDKSHEWSTGGPGDGG